MKAIIFITAIQTFLDSFIKIYIITMHSLKYKFKFDNFYKLQIIVKMKENHMIWKINQINHKTVETAL